MKQKNQQQQITGEKNKQQEHVYRVAFKEPPLPEDNRTDFFFTSLAAIYERFTPEQIGCRVSRLWNIGVSKGNAYDGRRCSVTKELLLRKSQNKPPVPGDNF